MAKVRKLGFIMGAGRNWCTSDADLVSANTTTDTDFTATIGRKADTAATAVGTTASLLAMVKYVANLLNGTRARIGQILTLVAAGKRPASAGVTVATATGTVFIKNVHLKKLTADETSLGAGGLWLTTDDTVAMNLQLRKGDGTPMVHTDFTTNASWTFPVNWQLATTKVLKIHSTTQGQAAGYQIHVEAVAVTENASIA